MKSSFKKKRRSELGGKTLREKELNERQNDAFQSQSVKG